MPLDRKSPIREEELGNSGARVTSFALRRPDP